MKESKPMAETGRRRRPVFHYALARATALAVIALIWACSAHENPPPDVPARPADVGASDSPTTTSESAGPGAQNWRVVERGQVELVIPTVGSFRARQTSKLATQVSGRVERVLVDVGMHVEKGQELVRLDTNLTEIEVAQRRAEVESAQVALKDSQTSFDRLNGLWNEGNDSVIPQQMLDEARARRDEAEAHLKSAREALRYSQQRMEESIIRAPYAGMITQRMVDPGEAVTVQPVTPMLEIQETDVLELVLSLPQNSMALVRPGTPLRFQIDGLPGLQFETKVDTVYPTLDEATRSFLSRAWVDNHELRIRPGMLAQVGVVSLRAENVLRVPRQSLSRTADGWSVMVDRQGSPTLQNVEVGLSSVDFVEVRSGLKEGDRVLILGSNV